ncbi:MAG: M14 family metallopeptidase [Gemmatimonadetes bacterium]|nr:M14 family metallopeptidase [Gemmatimonadota bacterium]MDA1103984.1 M14 family metallopeptidase [Gemmatimonadota bacterium]
MLVHSPVLSRLPRPALLAVLLIVQACAFGESRPPLPSEVIGFTPGEDFKLSGYGPIAEYFEMLAASTDRMVLEQIGESTRGEPLYLAAISTPANLARLERYKEITRTLAYARDPEGGYGTILGEEEARALAQEGKAIVWIDGGLHATEVAHGQVMPEMAYHFVTDESAETRAIRENTILLLMVNMNPDGLNIVADWYMSNVGTEFEMARVPELYHHYVGHDNNRDWYMLTQVETQAVTRQLYHNWFPQIVYNQHQSSPFPGRIWMPPFADPVNPNLDPLLVSSLNQMGHSMRKRFDVENKPGVNSGIVFDLWWNGSMRGGPDYHNMLGFLTETAGAGYATPACYDDIPETFGARGLNLPALTPSTSYNNPWLGGCWHLRDAMDYMMTAAKAVAATGATLKAEYLFNHYWMGRRQIERGMAAQGGPFAYVLDPRASHDPSTVFEFMDLMAQSGIEFIRASADFSAGGQTFAAGSYVIPPQAFRPYVVDLMEAKQFPDRRQFPGGPPIPPYDMTGYELRFQMGLEAVNIDEPFAMPAGVWGAVGSAAGTVSGEGTAGYLVHGNSNWLYRALGGYLEGGGSLFRTRTAVTTGDGPVAAGAFWLPGLSPGQARGLADDFGLTLTGLTSAPPAAAMGATRPPRVAIYRSWGAPMPEGWTRWVLDQYGIAWENVWDADVRAGRLADFDVVILPDQSENGIRNGNAVGSMPVQYTGGLGSEGATALRSFVREGGWLVAFDASVDYAISTFSLPIRNRTRGVSSQDFFLPGSIVRLDVDPNHPLGYGMASDAVTLFAGSQVLEPVIRRQGVSTPVCFPANDYLVSGWTLGGDRYLAGQTAAAQVSYGSGQVVLFGFTPHFRGQPRNTFKLLFNALWGASTDGLPLSGGLQCAGG